MTFFACARPTAGKGNGWPLLAGEKGKICGLFVSLLSFKSLLLSISLSSSVDNLRFLEKSDQKSKT